MNQTTRTCFLAAMLAMTAFPTASSLAADGSASPSAEGQSQDAPPARKFLTLAYYYPWYTRGDWSRHGYVGTPKLGKYGTDDPKIAAQHIRWARQGGIDALVVSWWGPDHLAARHTARGLLKAENLDEIRFAMIYESLGRLDGADGKNDTIIDFSKPAVGDRFVADFKLLKETYFDHPSYLKLSGRPVVVLYVTRTFRNFNRRYIQRAETESGVDLYLVADEPFFGPQKEPRTALWGIDDNGRSTFDAYTTYNMFENARVRDGESATDYMLREALPIFEAWSRKTVFCPQAMPSYHDFRGNKVLRGDGASFTAQLKALQQLPQPPDAPDEPRLLFVTSFNEWWEGTTIEPADEYGATYLDALRKAMDSE